jgi:hypothetical protein
MLAAVVDPIRGIDVMCNYARLLTLLSVETRRPTGSCLASFPTDAPASATTGRSSHAYTVHTVHTGAACRTRGNDQFVCLMEGYGRQSLC